MEKGNLSEFQKDYWERTELYNRRKPTHPVIKSFVNSKIMEIKKYIAISKNTELLEVGAGNGFFSYYFDILCQVTATDFSEVMLKLNPVKNKFLMDATDLKFPDNSFDIVFESCMLHHLNNYDFDRVILEMKRVSKNHLVFVEPNRNNPLVYLFCLAVKEEWPALNFSLCYLRRKLLANGLKVVAAFSHGVITPNKMPNFLLPFVSCFDKRLPFCGMNNIFICDKGSNDL